MRWANLVFLPRNVSFHGAENTSFAGGRLEVGVGLEVQCGCLCVAAGLGPNKGGRQEPEEGFRLLIVMLARAALFRLRLRVVNEFPP